MDASSRTPVQFVWGPLDGRRLIVEGAPPYYRVAIASFPVNLLEDWGEPPPEPETTVLTYERSEEMRGRWRLYYAIDPPRSSDDPQE